MRATASWHTREMAADHRIETESELRALIGTPVEIVRLLQAEVARAMLTDDMKQFLVSQVAEPGGATPEEFAQMIREETAMWAAVANLAGMERQ